MGDNIFTIHNEASTYIFLLSRILTKSALEAFPNMV